MLLYVDICIFILVMCIWFSDSTFIRHHGKATASGMCCINGDYNSVLGEFYCKVPRVLRFFFFLEIK